MAEAEAGGLTDMIAEIELAMPLVPHVALSSEELDRHYPPFTAPSELDNPDLDDQSPDLVYENGLRIAEQIERDMVVLGRTRKDAAVRNSCALKDTAKVATSAEGQSESHQTVT